MTYVLPTLPHATLSDVSLLQQRGKVNGKLFLMKSGERVFYSVLAIYMNCMVIEWTQRFLLISRGKNEFKKSTFILVITFYILILQFCILNIQYESHVIVCSVLCARYITCNLSFKYSFRKRMPF